MLAFFLNTYKNNSIFLFCCTFLLPHFKSNFSSKITAFFHFALLFLMQKMMWNFSQNHFALLFLMHFVEINTKLIKYLINRNQLKYIFDSYI